MAYAINYPYAAREPRPTARPSLLARVIARMQDAQLSRARREVRLFAPHLETALELGEYRKVSDDQAMPFVK